MWDIFVLHLPLDVVESLCSLWGEFQWTFYQRKKKMPLLFSLFKGSFSTFEHPKLPSVQWAVTPFPLQKDVPKYIIGLHNNLVYFQTKVVQTVTFPTYILGGTWYKCHTDNLTIMTLLCGLSQSSIQGKCLWLLKSIPVLLRLFYQRVLHNVSWHHWINHKKNIQNLMFKYFIIYWGGGKNCSTTYEGGGTAQSV